MRYLIGILLLLSVIPAKADIWLTTGGISFHSAPGYNGFNPGYGVEIDLNLTLSFIAGSYKNSFKIQSDYFGLDYSIQKFWNFDFGISAGEVSGYGPDGSYRLALLPYLKQNFRYVGTRTFIIPPIDGGDVFVLAVEFRFRK